MGRKQVESAQRAGPAAAPERVWLSAATLVVVPATVVEHWRHQLASHTAFGALRVEELNQACRRTLNELSYFR